MRVMPQLWSVAALALAVGACAKEQTDNTPKQDTATPAMMGSAEYTIVLKSKWTPVNHPFEYPKANPLTGPHFSGLIGAAHNESYSIFQEGGLPTPGLERLSEEGKHTPLDEEIKAAIASDKAGMIFETGALRDFGDSLVTTVRVDDAHPLISLVAMVAPSPDWFTGVANVNLMENGAWAASRTLDLIAYDSGGDDGTTYKAADKDNNPKKPTSKAATPHFVVNGVTVPVGSVTFIKK
ncbi:MAG TPA: spondin domain-containing protein [Gemmatimonadaceae bacterium]|nr:spondin domain-containing protein [Gemmatimonadaceae bacterium]